METSLPSFLHVQYVNFSKYCKYPFLGPLYTILETTLAIDFNLKVSTIFVKEFFPKGGDCSLPKFPEWFVHLLIEAMHAKVFFW
jgi:hypothetical protein